MVPVNDSTYWAPCEPSPEGDTELGRVKEASRHGWEKRFGYGEESAYSPSKDPFENVKYLERRLVFEGRISGTQLRWPISGNCPRIEPKWR